MYKCQECGKQSKPTEQQYHKVIEQRSVIYQNSTHGKEIVKEIHVCEECK